MISYFIKRLLLIIPTLLIVSILIFTISSLAPGNPINSEIENLSKNGNISSLERVIKLKKQEYGLDLPLFYFRISRFTRSTKLDELVSEKLKNHLEEVNYQLASKEQTEIYLKYLIQLRNSNYELYNEIVAIKNLVSLTDFLYSNNQDITLKKSSAIFNYLISFHWNGVNNQYHIWISNVLKGDLGVSYQNNENVSDKISNAIVWTLILSISSLLISFLIAIPIAVFSIKKPNSFITSLLDKILFAFYASPTFIVASLLVLFLANPEFLYWFPSYGVGFVDEGDNFFEIILIRAKHLVLPISCWTYGSIAYLYRQMRKSLSEEMEKEYYLTAKSKGLSENSIIWNQLFKNSLIPIITILGSYLPVLISGSFVIEYIFSIPGMGSLTLEAFYARDYPILFGISMIASFATILGVFIADLLYHLVDPRWQLSSNKA